MVYALGDTYDVNLALDANTALKFLEDFIPDLILLDVMMPGMNGFEMCEKLKADHRFSEIPVIFLTVMNQINDKIHGFELGAIDYITKPFEVLEVQARVRNHLLLSQVTRMLSTQNEILEQRVLERTLQLEIT